MSSLVRPAALRVLALAVVVISIFLTVPQAQAVPSFGRQTGLACEACHTAFPELTPFGRRFKLNGYVLDNMPQVKTITAQNEDALVLNAIPPLSLMFQASLTRTRAALPDVTLPGGLSQNDQVLFPQQASLFYAGRIAPGFGGFIQITYDSASGSFGFDNTDLRYANHFAPGGKDTIFGITANNNPTVQDVWNSTPAWQTPFDQRSSAAPVPAASTLVDGTLGGDVAGLSAYVFWHDSLYAEIGAYRSAKQGFTNPQTQNAGPLNSTASNVIEGVAPYWRLAYEWDWGQNALSVGTYGMDVKLLPGGGTLLGGATNHFTDTALDAQYQFLGDEHLFSLQTTFIHERQRLDASFAAGTSANAQNTLNTFRFGGSYYFRRKYGAGLGYFSTSGSTDTGLYNTNGGPVTGSASGSPNSRGWTAELDWLPWQNVKFALQYTLYNKFNGASSNYDGFGRNAGDNNTLYLLGWINF
jgi:hypothetical protein